MSNRREILEELLEQDPNDAFSRYALALELEKEGRQADAIQQLEQLRERDPDYLAVYYQLGRLLALAGRENEAREVYRRGVGIAETARDQRTRAELEEAIESLG